MRVLAELEGGLRVVRGTRQQLPQVVALLADDELGGSREREADDPAYAAAFEQVDADPNQLLAVVLDDRDQVVGTLQISLLPGLSRGGMLRSQIEAVRVAADRRGTGLGTAMFEWAIGHSRAQGAGLVQLTTDKSRPQAKAFYEGLGFTASHEGMKLPL